MDNCLNKIIYELPTMGENIFEPLPIKYSEQIDKDFRK